MASCCNDESCLPAGGPVWRRVLRIVLAVDAAVFLAEIVAGVAAGSACLQADAIDFLGDTANCAISIGVTDMALGWRVRAALINGWSLGLLGMAVLASTTWLVWVDTLPEAGTMGAIGVMALVANAGVGQMLCRFRGGDSNMRSVWISSCNDVTGNLAELVAAVGAVGTGRAGRT